MRCAIVVLFVVAAFSIGEIKADECALPCPRSLPTLVVPNVQSTYVYSLEAKTVLTPRDTQKVTIKADAEVAIQSQCQASLRLRNVAVEGVPNGADLAAELTAHPLTFGYFDGKLQGVCPVKAEEEFALNVKKAIVSALQLSTTSDEQVEEVDFSGRCKATYTNLRTSEDGTVFVRKTKDLLGCEDRHIDLRQTPDQLLGQVKNLIRHTLHPMESNLNCEVSLKDRVVFGVDCNEQHILRHRHDKPIHKSNIKLSLKETKSGVASDFQAADVSVQPITFSMDHHHDHKQSQPEAMELLKKLCSEISGKSLNIESSNTFQKLSHHLKYLTDEEAMAVDAAVKDGSLCPAATYRLRELFLDASAFAASDSSIKTLVKAHEANELSPARAAAAFTVVALKAQPRESTIKALMPLVNSDATTRPILIGYSVLIRRYCEKTADCATNPSIKEARDVYSNRLAQVADPIQKMALIKSLENLNINTEGDENVAKNLDAIVNDASANSNLRTAALQALPNNPSHNDHIRAVALNEENPNELRIAALRKLANTNGIQNMEPFFAVQEPSVKNFALSYLKNLKESKFEDHKALGAGVAALPEEPKNSFGVTRNIVHEYSRFVFDYDIIYPKDSNVTKAINIHVSRLTSDNKLKNVVEVQLYQDGLDPQVGNILNLLGRKISPVQFGVQAIKDIVAFLKKLQKKDHAHQHLQTTVKLNNKIVFFGDAFEDFHRVLDMLRARVEKIRNEHKIDRTIGGVLLDSKVLVPTITGIPLAYRLSDNFIVQLNAMFNKDEKKLNVDLNRSLVVGVLASAKMLLKNNKLGYEYESRLAFTPQMNFDFERDNGYVLRFNIGDLDQRTVLKFKQSLREVRSDGVENSENELAPEPRSNNCVTLFLLSYCRKASQVKGLLIPNVEYSVSKPEKEVTALELRLQKEALDNMDRYSAKLVAVGSPSNKEVVAAVEIHKGDPKVAKLIFKTPERSFESTFTRTAGQGGELNMAIDFPQVIKVNLNGKFEKDKETNTRNNNFLVEYTFPDDPTTHTIKYKQRFGYNLKRSSKEKMAFFDYATQMESSRRPYLNYRTAFLVKYRPLKHNEINLEFAHGDGFTRQYQFHRVSNVDVAEMKPLKMTAENDVKILATPFDVNLELKANVKIAGEKSGNTEFNYKLKGKNLSKRAAEGGYEDIDGELSVKNEGPQINSNINAHLKAYGKEYGYESQMKQVDANNYEGKITIQTDKDKKIFVNHKTMVTKPTKEFHMKVDADVSYSYQPDKKTYNFEVQRANGDLLLTGAVKKNDQLYYSHDVKLEKSGKFHFGLTRDYRSYDLNLDNLYRPTSGNGVLKVKDRVYTMKLTREPLKFTDITVEGNAAAYIKQASAHLSLVDGSKVQVLTNADGKVFVTFDPLHMANNLLTVKIDSPKYKLNHDGYLKISPVNLMLSTGSTTTREDRKLVVDVQLTPRKSTIKLEHSCPMGTKTLNYARSGDHVNADLKTPRLEGHLEGDRKSGTIHLKNKETAYELNSSYKVVDHKLVIEPTSSSNAKLEGVLSFREPSHFVFESPKINTHFNMDLAAPVKTLHFDFDNENYEKKIDAKYQPGEFYDYSSYGKVKSSGAEHKVEVHGKPRKALSAHFSYPNFDLKLDKAEGVNKATMSYTINEYTETEEFEFNPHQSYYANWLRISGKIVGMFITD